MSYGVSIESNLEKNDPTVMELSCIMRLPMQ